mgnify:CR=1 FL=1
MEDQKNSLVNLSLNFGSFSRGHISSLCSSSGSTARLEVLEVLHHLDVVHEILESGTERVVTTEIHFVRLENVIVETTGLIDALQSLCGEVNMNLLIEDLRGEGLRLNVRLPSAACLSFRVSTGVAEKNVL